MDETTTSNRRRGPGAPRLTSRRPALHKTYRVLPRLCHQAAGVALAIAMSAPLSGEARGAEPALASLRRCAENIGGCANLVDPPTRMMRERRDPLPNGWRPVGQPAMAPPALPNALTSQPD